MPFLLPKMGLQKNIFIFLKKSVQNICTVFGVCLSLYYQTRKLNHTLKFNIMKFKLFKIEQDPRSESLPDVISETPVWFSGDQSQLPPAPTGYMWGTSIEDVEDTITTKNRDEFKARNHARAYGDAH